MLESRLGKQNAQTRSHLVQSQENKQRGSAIRGKGVESDPRIMYSATQILDRIRFVILSL